MLAHRVLVATSLLLAVLRPVGADAQSIVTRGGAAPFVCGFGHRVGALGNDLLVANSIGISRYTPAGIYPHQIFLDPLGGYSAFGAAMAALGTDLLVGDPGAQLYIGADAVFRFDGSNSMVTRTFYAPQAAAAFGAAVAAVGANVLVGAPTESSGVGGAYLFDGSTGALLLTFVNPTPEPDAGPTDAGDAFGTSVAALGSNVLVSAPFDNTSGTDRGAVYHFDGATGALLQTYLDPLPLATTVRGFGVSVATLGGNVVVGTLQTGGGNDAYLVDATTAALLATFSGGGSQVRVMGGNVLGGSASPYNPTVLAFDGTTGALLREFRDPIRDNGDMGDFAVAGSSLVMGDLNDGFCGLAHNFCGGLAGCGPCETCDSAGACVVAPNPSCGVPYGPYTPGIGSVLKISLGARDRLSWKWIGQAGGNEFGEPSTYPNDYTLCMFDGAGSLLFRATAPAESTCGTGACWTERPQSQLVKYATNDYTPDGIARITLRGGRKGRLRLSGKGELLSNRPFGLPALPLSLPVRVQLQARDGLCWEAQFTEARPNTTSRFIARVD